MDLEDLALLLVLDGLSREDEEEDGEEEEYDDED